MHALGVFRPCAARRDVARRLALRLDDDSARDPRGRGKTLLGLYVLAAGAQAGEAGLHVAFYETPRRPLSWAPPQPSVLTRSVTSRRAGLRCYGSRGLRTARMCYQRGNTEGVIG